MEQCISGANRVPDVDELRQCLDDLREAASELAEAADQAVLPFDVQAPLAAETRKHTRDMREAAALLRRNSGTKGPPREAVFKNGRLAHRINK
jgi:hypothetical protein